MYVLTIGNMESMKELTKERWDGLVRLALPSKGKIRTSIKNPPIRFVQVGATGFDEAFNCSEIVVVVFNVDGQRISRYTYKKCNIGRNEISFLTSCLLRNVWDVLYRGNPKLLS
jgi:hypothetical protein